MLQFRQDTGQLLMNPDGTLMNECCCCQKCHCCDMRSVYTVTFSGLTGNLVGWNGSHLIKFDPTGTGAAVCYWTLGGISILDSPDVFGLLNTHDLEAGCLADWTIVIEVNEAWAAYCFYPVSGDVSCSAAQAWVENFQGDYTDATCTMS